MKKAVFGFFIILLSNSVCIAGWDFDFSRRMKSAPVEESRAPASQEGPKDHILDMVFGSKKALNELVVLNTENGFVPSTVRVKQGLRYKINVVNVNKNNKNISFVLDAFSEHHATYYGEIKTFYIQPQAQGSFSFQCPETSAQGRLVVFGGESSPEIRLPASE
ncbi:MAG: cupredoxin domain-containing protein [Bdellovibrionales bacterium]|nr:cupredoxin domain-containing protein [Bdellovibrionales bacterium]